MNVFSSTLTPTLSRQRERESGTAFRWIGIASVYRRQRGLAMVEMAITLPLLLLLLLAVAEFGRVLFQYNTMTKAVRDGGRYMAANALVGSTGTIDLTANATAVANAKNLAKCGKITCAAGEELLPGVTVTVAASGFDHVVVSAQYPYQPMVGAVLPTFGLGADINLNFTLSASVTMRVL